MPLEIVIPEFELPKLSNLLVLELSVSLFLVFAISELIGAIFSSSLSLLADSISMFADIFSYICNIYVEWYKNHYGGVSRRSRFYLEIVIPTLSVILLMLTTIYTTIDASLLLQNPPVKDDVDVDYMYGFSIFNMFVDFLCWMLFSLRGSETFIEAVEIPQLSLDTSITFDDELDFGILPDTDFDSILPSTQPSTSASNSTSLFTFTECFKLMSCGLYRPAEGTGGVTSPSFSTMSTMSTAISHAGGSGAVGGGSSHKRSNLNMLSAFIHVVGDTLRTISVLLAAAISTIFHVDGDICDAWAAIVASISILIMCGSLIAEIRKSWTELREDEVDGGISFSVGPFSHSSVKSATSLAANRAVYMKVQEDEDEG